MRLIFIVLVIFVSLCSSGDDCDAIRCRREGSGGKVRLGHRPLRYQEMPYLVVIMQKDVPFCFGVLISGSVRHLEQPHNIIILTTCSCAGVISEEDCEIGLGSFRNKYFKIKELITVTLKEAKSQKCTGDILQLDVSQFGYALPIDPYELRRRLQRVEYAHLKSRDTSVITEHINSLLEYHESRCFGVGYGGYDFIVSPVTTEINRLEHEGKKEGFIHLYDYRLITDEECDRYLPKCCKKNPFKGKSVKTLGFHCAIRGKEHSSCFGNLGSPIICDGYLIGFLKGHIKCEPDDKKYAGADIFVPISHQLDWIINEVRMELPSSFDRPMPEPLHDTLEDNENKIDEIFPRLSGKEKPLGGSGNIKKSGDDDDEYYNAAAYLLPNVILTTILNFIHLFSI